MKRVHFSLSCFFFEVQSVVKPTETSNSVGSVFIDPRVEPAMSLAMLRMDEMFNQKRFVGRHPNQIQNGSSFAVERMYF